MKESSPAPMTFKEARRRLGLKRRDRVEDYLPQWRTAEERLATLVVETQDVEVRAGYEADLASLREVLEVLQSTPEKKRPAYGMWIWALIMGTLFGAGFYGYQQWVGQGDHEVPQAAVSLDVQKAEFSQLLEKRRWAEAEEVADSLAEQGIAKDWLQEAQEHIAKGKAEEKGQQVGFLVGNAQAALEAGRLTEARKLCDQVEELQPDHPKLADLRKSISEGLLEVKSRLVSEEVQKAIEAGEWNLAEQHLAALAKLQPEYREIPRLQKNLTSTRERFEKDRAKADELMAKAKELDQGTYSEEAVTLLEEAMRLAPNDEIRSLYQKMSAYGRVLRVPEEFKTIAEAVKGARQNDRILLAKGTYHESLTLPAGIELLGESRKLTILEYEGAKGSVLTLNQAGPKVRVTSLTIRHRGLVNDHERFPAVVINGARLQLEDTMIDNASGHGLAVVNGGTARLAQCEVRKSGWDGIAVHGEGSKVNLSKVICRDNLHHGIDFWEGGTGKIESSQFLKNGRAGLVALSPLEGLEILASRSEGNREIGFLLSAAPSAKIVQCHVHQNQLGGVVVQDQSKEVHLLKNNVTKNGKAGVVLEQGVTVSRFEENVVEDNSGRQIWKDAVFPARQEPQVPSPPPPPPGS